MVLACDALGTLLANALTRVDCVARVDVVVAPWRSKSVESFLEGLRQDIHLDGIKAVARRAGARLERGRSRPAPPEPLLASGVMHHAVTDLHGPARSTWPAG